MKAIPGLICRRIEAPCLLKFCQQHHYMYLFKKGEAPLEVLSFSDCFGFYIQDTLSGIGYLLKHPWRTFINIAFLPAVRGKRVIDACRQWLGNYKSMYPNMTILVKKGYNHQERFYRLFGFETMGQCGDLLIMRNVI